ncbi:MAG: GNAT family N-acetyltransferase [Candidatus Zixiibacteriota bacterium]|nr:MAG: GNAT family N-acetyltransferase [candidate division Zixibacteria bacterium]
MDEASFRPADESDIDRLTAFIQAFYAEDGDIPFVEAEVRRAVAELIGNPDLGAVWIIEAAGQAAGYLVVTLGYSLEFHGRDAFLDELYLRPEYRGRDWGARAIQFAEGVCRRRGVRAVHLEVDEDRPRLQEYYRRAGYRAHRRRLMTKWLDARKDDQGRDIFTGEFV